MFELLLRSIPARKFLASTALSYRNALMGRARCSKDRRLHCFSSHNGSMLGLVRDQYPATIHLERVLPTIEVHKEGSRRTQMVNAAASLDVVMQHIRNTLADVTQGNCSPHWPLFGGRALRVIECG